MNQEIYLVGLNHKTAGVDIRERFALSDCDPAATGLVSDSRDRERSHDPLDLQPRRISGRG